MPSSWQAGGGGTQIPVAASSMVPPGQAEQSAEPASLRRPQGHGVQLESKACPASDIWVPAGHGEQAPAPNDALATVPGRHSSHYSIFPPSETVPEGHGAHVTPARPKSQDTVVAMQSSGLLLPRLAVVVP